ncbi:hypothetical protein ACTA71_002911 [Dictyostelium dimigraforme]
MIKKIKGRQRIQLIACNNINYVYKTEFHLGESAWKWNPTLKSFIYKEISQIHIIRIPAFLLIIGKALNLIREVMRFRGKVVIVANNIANGKVIEKLIKTMRQPAILTKYYAGGITRKTENLRQYLEAEKGLTNMQLRSKFVNQLIGLQDLEKKPAYVVLLDAIQGKYLISESEALGIPTIGCGDTTINLPKLKYPLIGNFKSREKRGSVLLLMKHAMFEGMRQEATIFAEYIILIGIYVIGLSGLIFNKNNIINILIISELNLGTLGMLFVLASVELNDILGELSGLYILTFTAAESAIGLAIVVILYSKTGGSSSLPISKQGSVERSGDIVEIGIIWVLHTRVMGSRPIVSSSLFSSSG